MEALKSGSIKERVSKRKTWSFITEMVVTLWIVIGIDPEIKELLELEREGYFMRWATDREEVN